MSRAPSIELLCVGTELLRGQVNTHQSRLAVALGRHSLFLARGSSLPDDAAAIASEIRRALKRSDVLLICGGLGPTFDDVTREAAAMALGRKLLYRPALFAEIKRKFFRYRLPVPEENKRQAFVIEGARVLKNGMGSAPGQLIRLDSPGRPARLIALLPGPFFELEPMFEKQVLPEIRRRYGRGLFAKHLTVHLSGIPESLADEKLTRVLAQAGPGRDFTILSSAGQVDFHATIAASSPARAKASIASVRRDIYAAVGDHIFGEGPATLEGAVGEELRRRKLTLAVAESCTGGLLGERITAIAGSSDYFRGGVIAYANELKESLLKVSPETLKKHGAVSAQCAREMAEGVRRLCGSALGLSITGIAGPAGGTAKKPVGLVFIGLSGPSLTGRALSLQLKFSGNRATVRQRAAAAALNILLKHLKRT